MTRHLYVQQFLLLSAPLLAFASASGAPIIAASYRKDVYLPDMKEAIPYNVPTDGGRVHIVVANSGCAGRSLRSAKINGQDALNLSSSSSSSSSSPDFSYFDWAKAMVGENGTVWVSFHSRNTAWLPDSGTATLHVELTTAADDAADDDAADPTTGNPCFTGSVQVAPGRQVRATYVTTRKGGTEFVVHLHNFGKTAAAITRLVVGGAGYEGIPSLGPGQTHIAVLPRAGAAHVGVEDAGDAERDQGLHPKQPKDPLRTGDLWTVIVEVAGDPSPLGWGSGARPD